MINLFNCVPIYLQPVAHSRHPFASSGHPAAQRKSGVPYIYLEDEPSIYREHILQLGTGKVDPGALISYGCDLRVDDECSFLSQPPGDLGWQFGPLPRDLPRFFEKELLWSGLRRE